MKYQLFPNLTADEMEALTADIKERGVMVPVEKDEDDNILDGHHRVMIADSLGIGYPTVVRTGWSEDQKLVHVVALNAHRRHLTAIERADVVSQLRKAKLSTRAIAKAVGVGKDTVRRDLAVGAIAPPDAVTGTDGKSYPATQPFRPRLPHAYHAPAPAPTDYIDDMPPALAAEEREFRLRARWSTRIHQGAEALLSVDPENFAPLLDADERQGTERLLPLIEEWIARTRKALASTGALHIVGGSR